MKTQKLIAAFIILFLSIGLHAQDRNKVSEVKNSPAKKEYTIYDKRSGDYLYKNVYEYDNDNQPTSRITYLWDKQKGWVASSMHEYRYNDQKQIANVYYSKWNKQTNKWSDNMVLINNQYDGNGKLLSSEQTQVNKKEQRLLLSAY